MQTCRLCLKHKELISKSHIISDFFFEEIYNEKHKLVRHSVKNRRFSLPSSAEYEGGLLCADCDNKRLGGLEAYANTVIDEIKKLTSQNAPIRNEQEDFSYYLVQGIDYKKFKLFLVSILWRSSISTRPFFNHVRLGPAEERARKMLINEDVGSLIDFPCLISMYNKKYVVPSTTVRAPVGFRDEKKNRCYAFHIGQFTLMYFVSSHTMPEWMPEMSLNAQGTIKIPVMTDENARNFENLLLNELKDTDFNNLPI